MMDRSSNYAWLVCTAAVASCLASVSCVSGPRDVHLLRSWNEGEARSSIIQFVDSVTNPTSPSYVPPAERLAVFDNDGTLWSEQPIYVQLAFAIDQVKALAAQHPEWVDQQPFKAILDGDVHAALAGGKRGLMEIVLATHGDTTTVEFRKRVEGWIASAKHPETDRLYTEMVYTPMLELLAFLRANDFQTCITSGGGIEFMRPWSERVYGIPPEQVIGSSIKTKFEMRDGQPVLVRIPEINFVDDHGGKPVAINHHFGRRPLAAFGNSDGDLEMLQWTAAGEGARFCMIVHHTDGEREWAYDRESSIGKLDKALDEARKHGWTIANMKRDWKTIFDWRNIP